MTAAYAFTLFRSRRLDERQDEHRLELAADLLVTGPWRSSAVVALTLGDLPTHVLSHVDVSWRF